MKKTHKDTGIKETTEKPVKRHKNTCMEKKVQMLVLKRLVKVFFENQNVFGFIEVEVDTDDLTNYFNTPGKNLLYKLKQPTTVGIAAIVCKAWYAQVKKHRIMVLLEAVDYAHNYMIEKALELTYIDTYVPYPEGMPETIPPETYMHIEVHLGFRKMYAIEVVRSMIKPGDDEVPIKLNVQSSMSRAPMSVITGTYRNGNQSIVFHCTDCAGCPTSAERTQRMQSCRISKTGNKLQMRRCTHGLSFGSVWPYKG